MKNGALGGSFINTAVRAQAGGARERWLERIGRAPGHLGQGSARGQQRADSTAGFRHICAVIGPRLLASAVKTHGILVWSGFRAGGVTDPCRAP